MSSQVPTIDVGRALLPFFLGVDVGGQSIKFGVVDCQGRTLGFDRVPTNSQAGPTDGVQRLKRQVEVLLAALRVDPRQISRVGLATPGTMDIPNGMILDPPNMPGWENTPIQKMVSDALEKPVTFANDANAAAYGEFWVGTGKQFSSMVLLTLGTGVGGGIIVGDTLVEGAHSHGAECGHILLEFGPDARICGCGQPGHLEAYASATALTKRAEEALALPQYVASSLHARKGAGSAISPLVIADEAERGDSLSKHLVLETARYLGIGIVSLMHAIDPEGVVLGGAMNFGGLGSPLGREFLERVRQEVRLRAFPVLAAKTTVDFASLGGDAGYLGAAGLARRDYFLAMGATPPGVTTS